MSSSPVRIGPSTTDVVLGGALLGAVGLVAGLVLPWLAQLVLGLPWLPFQGHAEVVQRLADHVPVWVLPAIGLVAGAVLGVVGTLGDPEIFVDAREIVVRKGAERRRLARSQVAESAVRGKHLVLWDAADVELLHQKVGGDLATLERALEEHGWPPARF